MYAHVHCVQLYNDFSRQKEEKEEDDDDDEAKKKLGQCEINTVSGRHLSAMYAYGSLVCLFFFLRPYRLNIFFDVDDQVRISSGAVCVHADISSSPRSPFSPSIS